jgi:chain length determinant protein EpsF
MNVQQFLIILRARLALFAAALAFTVCGTVVVSLLLPKQYTAAASVVIDAKGSDLMATGLALPTQMAPGFMATQVDIMASQKVALKVVEKLRVVESQVAQQQFKNATEGRGSIRHYFADLLIKKLDIKPSRESSVVTITYTANDPKFAAAVANAFAEAYIETTLEMKVAPSRQNAVWFGDQLKSLRGDLEKAQRRLSEYQQANGIVGVDERLDVENTRLSELSSQLVGAQGQNFESRGRSAQVTDQRRSGGGPESLPEVVTNPLIQNLRAELARAEARMQDSSSQLGDNHPQMERMRAEVGALREKLATEMKNVASSVITSGRVSQQRESETRVALAAQKEKVLEIKRQRDEMAVLSREVENAQRIFDVALQRFAQTNLEGQATLANATLLNPAVEPSAHSSPRLALNVSLSVILGIILGLGVALLAELADRRVRSIEDLGGELTLPVIGVIGPSGRPPAGARRLLGLLPPRAAAA